MSRGLLRESRAKNARLRLGEAVSLLFLRNESVLIYISSVISRYETPDMHT